MKPFQFHPEAQAELLASARYYESRQPGLGKRYLEAVHTAIRRIQLLPSSYQRIEGEIRHCRVERFPYGIIFREHETQLEILAVMHFRQDPDYWKTRS